MVEQLYMIYYERCRKDTGDMFFMKILNLTKVRQLGGT